MLISSIVQIYRKYLLKSYFEGVKYQAAQFIEYLITSTTEQFENEFKVHSFHDVRKLVDDID